MPRGHAVLWSLVLVAPVLAGCMAPGQMDEEQGLVLEVDQVAAQGDAGELGPEANASARLVPGEGNVTVEATVVNTRGDPVRYRGGCDDSWELRVEDESGQAVPVEAPAACLGFDPLTLEPGETVREQATWNGTRWTSEGYEPVEPGTYEVILSFTYRVNASSDPSTLIAGVPVEVGEARSGNGPNFGGEGDRSGEGLVLLGDVNRSVVAPGEEVGLHLVAGNDANRTVWFRHGCGYTWEMRVLHEGEQVNRTQPRVRCQGFQPQELAPGTAVERTVPWNGTVWNGSAYVPAEEGEYTLQGGFEYAWERNGTYEVLWASVNVTVTRSG